MIVNYRLTLICLLGFLFSISQAGGQEKGNSIDTLRKGAVKLFIDCEFCDMDYIRQQIPYVNYVRDTREAETYLLITRQDAGSGGMQYTFLFHGDGRFSGMNDTLVYTSSPDETRTQRREKRTNYIKMGLMRYVAKTPLSSEIEIRHNSELVTEDVVDRWNNWVFEISTEPVFESEEANREVNLRNSVNITKITDNLKLEIEFDQFYNREKFIENVNTDSAETETYVRRSRSLSNLFVKSMGEHWSAGLKWDLRSSSRENYDFATEILPALEYDIFPYSQSTHRQLRILYGAGFRYNNYVDTTVYFKTTEMLPVHSLALAFQVQKKWGSINLSMEASNYLNDFSKNRIELMSDIRIRVFKGLALEIGFGAAHINDQINLKKGNISEAERLLKLTELATKYRFEGGIEITYTFGSIYNNIVNPRFSRLDYY